MQNEVYLDKQGIIVIEVVGDQDVPSVELMGRQVEQLITEQRHVGKPCLILDDLLRIGKVGPEARKMVVDLSGRLDYDRAAMLGKGGIMRFGANLMLRTSGHSYKIKYFDDRQKALAWLRGTQLAS